MWKTAPKKVSFDESLIHIWLIEIDRFVTQKQLLWPTLSIEEQKQASQFVNQQDHNRYILTHGISRLILGRYLSQYSTNIRIGKEAYGKPILLDHNHIHFNLSHSANKALLAISSSSVGVDIEYISPHIPFDDLVPHFMSNTEQKQFESLLDNEKCQTFYRYWTHKEAYVKAIGMGLSYPITQVTFSFDDEDVHVIDEVNPFLAEKWNMIALPQMESFCSALFTDVKSSSIECIYFDF